jgi:hypothetical protein
MLRYAIGLVALLTIFSSCESDFNLTGEYQEKALIYGLLDPTDNPNPGSNPNGVVGNGHFFRIQKAFLGEESAFIMALEPDSSYFKPEDLFVELVEYNGVTETNRWVLDTVTIANKDTGNPDDQTIDFFGPSQRLYKTRTDGTLSQNVNIDPTREYEVTLKKRPAGVSTMTIANMADVEPIADARTEIIDLASFRWNAPNQTSQTQGITQRMDLFNTSGDYKDYTLRFDVADRAVRYEVWLRFYYREVILGVETVKYIEWRVSSFELESGVSSWQVQLSAEGIFSRIGSELDQVPNVIRYIGLADGAAGDPDPNDGSSQDFEIEIRLAGEELFQYIDINNPSNSGALQDKPVYTNVNNGLGVFSSRSSVHFYGIGITSSTSQQLVGGQYTSGLGLVEDD